MIALQKTEARTKDSTNGPCNQNNDSTTPAEYSMSGEMGYPVINRAKYRRLGGFLLLLCFVCFAFVPPAFSKQAKNNFSEEELEPLLEALEEVGFERDSMEEVFYDSRLKKIDRVVAINALNPDSANIYKQFTSPFAIHISRKFLRKQRKALMAVEKEYGVPKEIIVGILLVETQFGRAKLPYRVLDVFTTLAVEANPKALERHYKLLRSKNHQVKKDWLASRLIYKAEFAFTELVAIMAMNRENLSELFQVRGSYAGAIGIPQFLPSSHLLWGVDGNGDGVSDLNHLPDAMASVGNYLRSHGWTKDATLVELWKSVWSYNHSENYVRAIFEVAFRVKAKPSKRYFAKYKIYNN